MTSLVYLACAALVVIGLYTVMTKRNLIKIAMGVTLIEAGANLFLISLGYVDGAVTPIFTMTPSLRMVLPMPQAAVLTSIVIGVAVAAMMLSFAMNYYKHYGTLDATKGRLKG